jgi:hypothetical protein
MMPLKNSLQRICVINSPCLPRIVPSLIHVLFPQKISRTLEVKSELRAHIPKMFTASTIKAYKFQFKPCEYLVLQYSTANNVKI